MYKKPALLRVAFGLVAVVYPSLVYFGIGYFSPAFFGALLAMLLIFRVRVLTPAERSVLLPLLGALLVYAIAAILLGSTRFLLLYPVLVNFSLCGVFAWSLRGSEPTLLRIVKARGIVTSEHSLNYLFRLTGVWAAFFLVNGMLALWTTTQSMETWTLYNGLISYVLIAFLMGAEFLFRIYYKRRKGTYQVSSGVPPTTAD